LLLKERADLAAQRARLLNAQKIAGEAAHGEGDADEVLGVGAHHDGLLEPYKGLVDVDAALRAERDAHEQHPGASFGRPDGNLLPSASRIAASAWQVYLGSVALAT
jgi:hypothetical protein